MPSFEINVSIGKELEEQKEKELETIPEAINSSAEQT